MGEEAKEEGSHLGGMKAHLLAYPQAQGVKHNSLPVKSASDTQHSRQCTDLQVSTTWTRGKILLAKHFHWLYWTAANKPLSKKSLKSTNK